MTLDLLSLILPEDLLLYFDIVNFQELGDISVKKDGLHIYLEEKNQLPKGYSSSEYESKGFSRSKQVQDFPIRGKAVYTYLAHKNGRGKKGTLVACIKGVRSDDLIKTIERIPLEKRKQVKEVTLDMANNMNLSAKTCFPNAKIVTDRFHVVKLVMEALQYVRVQYLGKR